MKQLHPRSPLFHIACMNLGKALVYARKMKGISQNQLARDSGTNRGYLYKLENDRISPTINTVERLCEILGITVSDLVEIAEMQEAGTADGLPENDSE